MIIQYDTRPDATIDEKLRSLIKSMQLALDELGIQENNNVTSQSVNIDTISAVVRNLSDEVRSFADAITGIDGRVDTLEDTTIPGIDGRVTALEGRQALPAAPTTDGAYKLTVTVTDGTPVYTWETA